MHDELISMELPPKMLGIPAINFQPMKPINISMKRKFSSNGHHYRPHLTSASSDISNDEHQNCEDEDYDSRTSSTLIVNGDLVKTDSSKLANDINIPSPPSSTRSSFDNDGITRDSFIPITNADNTDQVANVQLFDSPSPHNHEINVILEGNDEPEMNDPNVIDTFEDDIRLITENLVRTVSADFDSENDKSESDYDKLWEGFKIDLEGETILPSGLRLIGGVAEMPFIREDSKPARFTNQLNFLKTIMTKFICRYKTALPFLYPVNSVQLKIPHYYLVIRKPMDLTTVKNRINFLWYRSANECIAELRLIFSNCYHFNSPNDFVYKAGKKLEEYLDHKLKEMPTNEVEIPLPELPNIEDVQKLNSKKIIKPRNDSISENVEFVEKTSFSPSFGPIKMTTRSERGVMVRKPSKDLPTPISTPQPKTPTTRKVPLNQPMRTCYNLVKEMFTKKHAEYAWPFWEPVNTEKYTDYLHKIKRPIDLSTIKTNIETGKYLTINEFASDMRLMFSNCLRYNTPESPVIEQARQLREVFEYQFARYPEDWFHQKLSIHSSSSSRNTSPSIRNSTVVSTVSTKSNDEKHKSKKSANKVHSDGRKSLNKRNSVDSSGHKVKILPTFSGPSISGGSVLPEGSRMEILERQVATLTVALQSCLERSPDGLARNALLQTINATNTINGKNPKGRPRKNRLETKSTSKKGAKKQTSTRNKRKHHLSSEDESQSDDDDNNQSGGLMEPFNPEALEDLQKLKDDLENLRAKDLQNVLRILQNSEPSLRCDEDANVEIDFEKLSPKTLIALRKYVNSCMLNAKSPLANLASSANPNRSSVTMASNNNNHHHKNNKTPTTNSSNKRFCHSSNSLRSVPNLDTDCDNSTNNNWSRAGSRASDLQLSESSSSDSEIDD
ncbi:hypothetical protein BLOT_000538 [Blomia tropicalis]|nr:hypothetical protein BLOT_000538 [Blomia tropicalis]